MEIGKLIPVLDALAQRTRLDVIQLLLRHEPNGLSSGDVARKLKVPQNTMSSHLARLSRAGLVRQQRRSRFIIYRADRAHLTKAFSALLEHFAETSKRAGGRPA